jgi:hypothetical protein
MGIVIAKGEGKEECPQGNSKMKSQVREVKSRVLIVGVTRGKKKKHG